MIPKLKRKPTVPTLKPYPTISMRSIAGSRLSTIPRASDFGLAQRFDLYPPLIDDEIAFTDSIAEITTSFAHGITAFAATDSLLAEFKLLASNQTFIENDPAMFQWQCREFFFSGQTLVNIMTLSPENFQQLEPGEYAFALILTAPSAS